MKKLSATAPSPERILLKGGPQQVDKVIRKDGKPVYIERKTNPSKSDPNSSPGEKLSGFLEETRIISGTINPKEQFSVTQINEDRNGIPHLKTIQRYRGVDIYGGEIILTGINTRQIGMSGVEPGFYILEMTAGDILSRQKLLKK